MRMHTPHTLALIRVLLLLYLSPWLFYYNSFIEEFQTMICAKKSSATSSNKSSCIGVQSTLQEVLAFLASSRFSLYNENHFIKIIYILKLSCFAIDSSFHNHTVYAKRSANCSRHILYASRHSFYYINEPASACVNRFN